MMLFGDPLGYVFHGLVIFLSAVFAHKDTILKISNIRQVSDLGSTHIGILILIGLALVFWGTANQ